MITDINIGDKILSFNQSFINDTMLKEFIEDKVDISERLLIYVTSATTTWYTDESDVIEYIQMSLSILYDYYSDAHNTHIFGYLIAGEDGYDDFNGYMGIRVIKRCTISLELMKRYYILSLIIDFLYFDKRILWYHDEWISVVMKLQKLIPTIKHRARGISYRLIVAVEQSLKKYINIPLPFCGKFLLPIRTTNFNNQFFSTIRLQ